MKPRDTGTLPPEEAAAEQEDGWEINRWGVTLKLLGGPGEVEMGEPGFVLKSAHSKVLTNFGELGKVGGFPG